MFPERRLSPFVSRALPEWRWNMRRLSYVLAAIVTLAAAAPTIASAQEFGFRFGGDRDYYRDRDYGYDRGYDRGWHRGWYNHDRDRTVIIRRHHHWDD
jgi:hypothetical protein